LLAKRIGGSRAQFFSLSYAPDADLDAKKDRISDSFLEKLWILRRSERRGRPGAKNVPSSRDNRERRRQENSMPNLDLFVHGFARRVVYRMHEPLSFRAFPPATGFPVEWMRTSTHAIHRTSNRKAL
jgi:hypothetical protein